MSLSDLMKSGTWIQLNIRFDAMYSSSTVACFSLRAVLLCCKETGAELAQKSGGSRLLSVSFQWLL